MTARYRKARGLLLAAGLGIFALLIARTGPALLLAMLGRIGWGLGAITALYAAHLGLRSVALWRVVVDRPLGFLDALRARLSAEAIEVLTYTGPLLAEPAKGWLLTRRGLSATEAFAAVATEYLLYTTVSAGLTLLAAAWIASGPAADWLRTAARATDVAMLAFILAVAVAARTGVGLIVPVVRALGSVLGRDRMHRLADVIAPVEQRLVAFLHEYPVRLAEVFAIEIAAQALLVTEVWIVLSTLGLPFTARAPLILEGGGKVAALAFVVPGRFGVNEALFAALVGTVGLPAAVGITIAIVRRIRSLVAAAIGLLVLARWDDR